MVASPLWYRKWYCVSSSLSTLSSLSFKSFLSSSLFDSSSPDITIFLVTLQQYRYIGSFDKTIPRYISRYNFTAPLTYRYIGVPLYPYRYCMGVTTRWDMQNKAVIVDSYLNRSIYCFLAWLYEKLSLFICIGRSVTTHPPWSVIFAQLLSSREPSQTTSLPLSDL